MDESIKKSDCKKCYFYNPNLISKCSLHSCPNIKIVNCPKYLEANK